MKLVCMDDLKVVYGTRAIGAVLLATEHGLKAKAAKRGHTSIRISSDAGNPRSAVAEATSIDPGSLSIRSNTRRDDLQISRLDYPNGITLSWTISQAGVGVKL